MSDTKRASDDLKILLVDDQPAKLLSYEVILAPLGENLLKAASGPEALELLLKNDVAVVLIDVSMPELDGFQLAAMIREHPRFEKVAIIFVSAIHLAESDILRGYSMGAVDYVAVPIVPELLRAKVSTFLELHRKTRQLEGLNAELEERVAQRAEALEAASRRQQLLAREVDHRARNALAIVQAIVRLSRRDDVQTFADSVHGRIRAMARAHQLLSSSRWEGASLHQVIQEELSPYCDDDRVTVLGPPVLLHPSVAQMFALAVHELATNALKYGSLSSGTGRVELEWRMSGETFEFVWREIGGPEIAAPARRGFGMSLIDASIATQLQGHADLDWRRDGLVCTAKLPRESFVAQGLDAERGPAQDTERGRAVPEAALRGKRVLLVEDEALVALDLAHMLGGMGFEIIGPMHTLSEGLAGPLDRADVAVLDVNLRGENVSPLADRLKARGVPFVLVTGYERESLDRLDDAAAVLQKPVQLASLREALGLALERLPTGLPTEALSRREAAEPAG
jgi:two-component sensor histidine kinase/two-component SAPR family response regulator